MGLTISNCANESYLLCLHQAKQIKQKKRLIIYYILPVVLKVLFVININKFKKNCDFSKFNLIFY